MQTVTGPAFPSVPVPRGTGIVPGPRNRPRERIETTSQFRAGLFRASDRWYLVWRPAHLRKAVCGFLRARDRGGHTTADGRRERAVSYVLVRVAFEEGVVNAAGVGRAPFDNSLGGGPPHPPSLPPLK